MDQSAPQPPGYAAGPPPGYGASEESSVLPDYSTLDSTLPPTFVINHKSVQPLVHPSDLQAHLTLLGAFNRLREEVLVEKGLKSDQISLDQDELWRVFLSKAVYRFQTWVERALVYDENEGPGRSSLAADDCPPLDVVMVWHTYMLNPRTYWEDCLLYHKGLLKIGSFPLRLLASFIDPDSHLAHPPSAKRQRSFTSLTGQDFQYHSSVSLDDALMITCPACSFPNSVHWVTQNKTGYGQENFEHKCTQESCNMIFGHEALGVRKFCDDVERCILHPDKHYLPGTLVDPATGIPEPALAEELTGLIIGRKPDTPAVRPEVLGASMAWKVIGIVQHCREAFARDPKRIVNTPAPINRIFRAYRISGPFSVELTSAVVRQMSFVEKMYRMGWTEPGRFEADSTALTRSVVRYHAFLDLLSGSYGKFAVPTLDIDLAWHTHQLLATSYRKLHSIIGLVPDHDDKIEKEAIANGFDETAKAWKARFGVPYSVCGCAPTPASEQVGGSSFLSSLMRKGKSKSSEVPLENPRPDLISPAEVDSAPTHTSEHNSMIVLDGRKRYVERDLKREKEMADRRRNLEKIVEKRKGTGWDSLLLKRSCNMHEHAEDLDKIEESKHGGHMMIGDPEVGECTNGLPGWNGMCKGDFHFGRTGLTDSLKYVKGIHPHQTKMDGMGGVGLAYGAIGAYGACGAG